MRTVLFRSWNKARRQAPPGLWALLIVGCLLSALGAQAAGPAADGVRLESISARLDRQTVAVLIQTSEPAPYVTTQPDPTTVLVDLPKVQAAGVANRFAAAGQTVVSTVTVEETKGLDGVPLTRVRVSLSTPTPSRVRSTRNVIRVEVDRQPVVTAASDKKPSPAQPPAASATPATKANAEPQAAPPVPPREEAATSGNDGDKTAPEKAPVTVEQSKQAQAPAPLAPKTLAAPQELSQGRPLTSTQRPGEKQYTGAPISLDFAGADIRMVLRSFTEASGLNIIIDPKVQGAVDISLRDVPWDQALDIILNSNNLGYTVDGNVVIIKPIDQLATEEKARRTLAEEQALGGTLETLTRALSYATADDMKTLLEKSLLTKRGQIQTDKRTNTILVVDLPAALKPIAELIDLLDRPQPQVEIEARIVQTTRNFARQLGVQWGFSGRADPALGNTTGLAFPNQGSVSGRTGLQQGSEQQSVPSAVNLGVQGASSAVGIQLGAINGAFSLDAQLSALEKTGQGRLLSTPRVIAQNNFPAEMKQGVQIPIQTIANNTITVQFKDAALRLVVTPQITANKTVILNIELENATPDFTKSVNNIPPINTQFAKTMVLVKDTDTLVIGGIYVSQEQTQNDRTPMLHRIPLLGWLFRRDTIDEQANELLIFITPKIVKG